MKWKFSFAKKIVKNKINLYWKSSLQTIHMFTSQKHKFVHVPTKAVNKLSIRLSQGWKKSAMNYFDMFLLHNFLWRNRIHCHFNVLNWLRCPKNRLKIWPKIQRIFKIYKGKKFPTLISFFLVWSILFAKIGWAGVIAEVQTVV